VKLVLSNVYSVLLSHALKGTIERWRMSYEILPRK